MLVHTNALSAPRVLAEAEFVTCCAATRGKLASRLHPVHWSHLGLVVSVNLQRGGGHPAGWTERGAGQGTQGKVGKACLPGRSEPHDEADHQLALQEQGGKQE